MAKMKRLNYSSPKIRIENFECHLPERLLKSPLFNFKKIGNDFFRTEGPFLCFFFDKGLQSLASKIKNAYLLRVNSDYMYA